MYRNGVIAGKFLPPHVGHIRLIEEAAKACKHVFVVVSENPRNSACLCEECGLPEMKASLRIQWLKEHFKDNANIVFIYFDESVIGEGEDLVEGWCKAFKASFDRPIDALFVGEEVYAEANKKYFPQSKKKVIRRGIDTEDVCATEIREGCANKIHLVIPEGRCYFDEVAKKLKNGE